MQCLEAMQADQIICTHFLPAELLSDARRKGKLEVPVWVVVTDCDVHRLWVYSSLTGYFAASEEVILAQDDVQIVASAGRNEKLERNLRALARKFPGRIVALPFTSTIERLMACADLTVTKPGGLTTAECLAVGLPMVVISPIPGQEERNSDFLLEQGAGVKALDAAGVVYKVQQLLREPSKLEALRANAKRLGRPHAGREILNYILAD